ncbi:MAG: hypothetical protein LBR23_08880 [Spirochaetaceae bacterium]|jgi:TolB-like protein|nr:hypothetical protein [Spirochaetaceae bacterium]
MKFFTKRSALRAFAIAGLLLLSAAGVSAQNKLGKIAIIPFTGGTVDEREGIAELFSFTSEIKNNFDVIPRTTITNAVAKEAAFQHLSGLTDSDTMAELGRQVGAKYVLAGSITQLGERKLLIVMILQIEKIQQLAGDYTVYTDLGALSNDTTIASMAGAMVDMLKGGDDSLERLAVLSVESSGGVSEAEGDALAQILAIYLLQSGRYTVYPRMEKSLGSVQTEYGIQGSGVTADDQRVRVGQADNPQVALSVIARKIGDTNRFNAQIIDLKNGTAIEGDTVTYASLSDGIIPMRELTTKLTGVDVTKQYKLLEKRRDDSIKTVADTEKKTAVIGAMNDAVDKFLRNAGIDLSGWFGFGVAGTGRMETGSHTVIKDDGSKGTSTDYDVGFSGGGTVGVRLAKYFGVSSGFWVLTDKVPLGDTTSGEYVSVTTMQIPVLARFNVGFGNDEAYNVAAFGGLGLNVSSKADLDLTPAPASFIAGFELGVKILRSGFRLTAGGVWNGDIAESTVNYGGTDHSVTRGSFALTLGAGYFIPFKK